jgi:hypothetical protein
MMQKMVYALLLHYPDMRDDDNLLLLRVWGEQIAKHKGVHLREVGECTMAEFKRYLLGGKLYSTKSILRCRRKLQEEHPHLRGKRYAQRHGYEQQVRADVNLLFKD